MIKLVAANEKNLYADLEALNFFGRFVSEHINRKELEPVVDKCINTFPEPLTPAATKAVNELGKAVLFGAGPKEIGRVLAAQSRDASLTTEERSTNLLHLVFAAGWIAQRTKVELNF